jgi:hypothetical protein
MQKKELKKMDKCLKYQNNGYFDARLKKRRRKEKKKIAHVFLQLFPSLNERCFQGAM